MTNHAGHYKTNLSGEIAYRSFVPCPLPPNPPIDMSDELIALLIKANSQLAVLESVATRIISEMGRAAKNALLVFSYLEENPIIDIRKTAEALGITFNTASSAVNRLVEAGILVQTSNASRNRTFAYEAYLAILRKGT